jgi:putative transposase
MALPQDQPPRFRVTRELVIRRRQLPHWQMGGSVYFITFRSRRGGLPPVALRQMCTHILYDHGKRYDLVFGVVMPDHVHVVFQPREREPGVWFDLAEIMKGLKGASARSINQLLGTHGSVWQDESFDRIIRDENELEEKLLYMFYNPFKAGLVADPADYEFFVWPPDAGIQGQTGVSGPPE